LAESRPDVSLVAEAAESVRTEVAKAVVGQREVIDQIMIALLCEGHALLEGVPGIAKTLAARAVSLAISADFARIQFTPDLMPSDVIGANVFDPSTTRFKLREGPIFTEILLADEINRTPPKTQAALLEAMQEKMVTIDGDSRELSPLFTVLATQNPIEFEGTYPLPEAQLDRFMLKIIVPYPARETEVAVLTRYNEGFRASSLGEAGIRPVLGKEKVLELRRIVASVGVAASVIDYIARLVRKTRENRNLVLGASPRASICLLLGSKAVAALGGREYVIPDDVKSLAAPVLRHRLLLRPEAEIEGVTAERVIESVLGDVEVPRQ